MENTQEVWVMANGSQLTNVVDIWKGPSSHCLSLEIFIPYKDGAHGLQWEQIQYNMIYFIKFCLLSEEHKSAHLVVWASPMFLYFPS